MVYYICIPKNLETIVSRFLLEAPTRFELVIEVLQTFALPLGYGTIIRNGAVDGARTRDLHLGKVALYQLSYYRIICVPWGGIEPPTRRFSVCCSTD